MATRVNIGAQMMVQMLKLSGAVQEAKNLKPVVEAHFEALEVSIQKSGKLLTKTTDPELKEIAKAGCQSLVIGLFTKGA